MELPHSQIAPSPNLEGYLSSSDWEYYNLVGSQSHNLGQQHQPRKRHTNTNYLSVDQPILSSKQKALFHPSSSSLLRQQEQGAYYSPNYRRGNQRQSSNPQLNFGHIASSIRSSGDQTNLPFGQSRNNRQDQEGLISPHLQAAHQASANRQIKRLNYVPKSSAQRSSGDYNMLSEFIGIRRSLMNVNYRQTCMCVDGRTTIPCPQCGVLDSSRVPSSRSQVALSSHRSLNSCSYRKISPMLSDHFQPQGAFQECPLDSQRSNQARSQTKLMARQKAADQVRRSHHRFDLRTVSPLPNSNPKEFDSGKQYGKPSHRRGSSRMQPSQSVASASKINYQNLQEYVLIENERHGSCAIQQQCNFCGNPDCFSPINGTHTCCLELLDQPNTPRQLETFRLQQNPSVDVIPEENFVVLRDSHRDTISPAISEMSPLSSASRFKKPAPKVMVTTSVQTSPRKQQQPVVKNEIACQVQAISSLDDSTVTTSNKMQLKQGKYKIKTVSRNNASIQASLTESVVSSQQCQASMGNLELQKRIAMLNKLCVFHLNRSTQHGQTTEQTRQQLLRNRELYNQCKKILNYLKDQFQDTDAVKGDGGLINGKEINSKTEPLDEDILYSQLKLKCDAILVPHVALFKFFKLPAKLEGNLVLITYLLNNTLDAIFERINAEPEPATVEATVEATVYLPRLQCIKGQAYDNIAHEIDQYYCKTLKSKYSAPVEEVQMTNFELQPETFYEGFADSDPIEMTRQGRNQNSDRKQDLASFDREKFYQRLGVNLDDIRQVTDEDEGCMMIAEVCTTEYGSVGRADTQEVAIEKSRDNMGPKLKADMVSFDRDAFYKRQGVGQESPEVEMAEGRISTLEHEPSLADHIPVILEKKKDPKEKKQAPDMVDREAFHQRQGVITGSTLDVEQTIELPTLKPMTQTWAYQAMRFDQKLTSEENVDDEDTSSFENEGNIETTDQEMVTSKLVQSSHLDQKTKLNDYVFDERQNIESDLSKFALKNVIRQTNNVGAIQHLLPQSDHRMSDRTQSSRMLSPKSSRIRQIAVEKDKHGKLDGHHVYVEENENATIENAVNFVSPVNRLGGKRAWNERQARFELRYGSPNMAQPVAEDTSPYQPHRSKIRKSAHFQYPMDDKKLSTAKYAKHGQVFTPIGRNDNKKFQFSKAEEESAPTVKIESSVGNFSERLKYNKDPMSYNRNHIEIDEEGNIKMTRSLSRSPSPIPRNEEQDSSVDEARTFVQSHLLFSHLMSIDAKKNTLSQLNQANKKHGVTKSIQQQAREHRTDFGNSSRAMSPMRSMAGSRGIGQMSSLSRLLSGGVRSKAHSPSRNVSFMSGGPIENHSIDIGQMPQPIVKQATKLKGQSIGAYISPIGRQVSHGQLVKDSHSSEFKQHTFYPNQLHQIIPEQLNEETQRNVQLNTGKFRKDNCSLDATKRGASQEPIDSPNSSLILNQDQQQRSIEPQGGEAISSERQNKEKRSSSISVGFYKYLKGSRESALNAESDSTEQVVQSKVTPRENQAMNQYYSAQMNGVFSSSLREQYKPSYRLPHSRQSAQSSGQDGGVFPRGPVSHSQRLAGSLSRQSNDKSQLGRSTVGDNSMMVHRKRHAIDQTKGPISGDIQPVFRLTKAQPITDFQNFNSMLQSKSTRNGATMAVADSQELMQRQYLFVNDHSQQRPKSSKAGFVSQQHHIRIENFDSSPNNE